VECRVRLGANITLATPQGDNALLHSSSERNYSALQPCIQQHTDCLVSSRRPDPSARSINKQDQQPLVQTTTLQPYPASQTTVDATAPGEIRPWARVIARFDPVLLTRAGKLARSLSSRGDSYDSFTQDFRTSDGALLHVKMHCTLHAQAKQAVGWNSNEQLGHYTDSNRASH
jgi:hypothetical protein